MRRINCSRSATAHNSHEIDPKSKPINELRWCLILGCWVAPLAGSLQLLPLDRIPTKRKRRSYNPPILPCETGRNRPFRMSSNQPRLRSPRASRRVLIIPVLRSLSSVIREDNGAIHQLVFTNDEGLRTKRQGSRSETRTLATDAMSGAMSAIRSRSKPGWKSNGIAEH